MKAPSFDDLLSKDILQRKSIVEPGLLPIGGKLVLGGPQKIGKSYIMLQMMKDLASGSPLFGCPLLRIPEPVSVHYFEQEIGEPGLQTRVDQLYGVNSNLNGNGTAVRGRVTYTSKDTSIRLDQPDGQAAIFNIIQHTKPAVTFFDPISKFHLVDENSSQEIGLMVKCLDHLIQSHGTTVVYSHHFAKPSFDNPREGSNKFRGSSQMGADADTSLMIEMTGDDKDQRLWTVEFELRQMEQLPKMILRWDKAARIIHFVSWASDLSAEQRVLMNGATFPHMGGHRG